MANTFRPQSVLPVRRDGARRRARAAIVGLTLCVSATAWAQSNPPPKVEVRLGSRIPVPVPASVSLEETASQRETSRIVHIFARCVVNGNPTLIASIVETSPYPVGEERAYRTALFARAQRLMNRCLRAEVMRSPESVIVGAFAEQLYRRRFRALPPLGPANLAPTTDPDGISLRVTLQFAACLIDRSGAEVDAFLRSEVGSDLENSALAALSDSFVGCLDDGSSLRLNRLTFRTALADQLYRRALAGAGVARPGGGA